MSILTFMAFLGLAICLFQSVQCANNSPSSKPAVAPVIGSEIQTKMLVVSLAKGIARLLSFAAENKDTKTSPNNVLSAVLDFGAILKEFMLKAKNQSTITDGHTCLERSKSFISFAELATLTAQINARIKPSGCNGRRKIEKEAHAILNDFSILFPEFEATEAASQLLSRRGKYQDYVVRAQASLKRVEKVTVNNDSSSECLAAFRNVSDIAQEGIALSISMDE